MIEIDEWIALGDPAERHVGIAAYSDVEDLEDRGWQAAARFEIWAATDMGHLAGDFRFWFFDELDQFREEIAKFGQAPAGSIALRTVGGEFELTLSSKGGRGEIDADVVLRKTGINPFEARFGYTFNQSHLTRIRRDLNRQFPKKADQ